MIAFITFAVYYILGVWGSIIWWRQTEDVDGETLMYICILIWVLGPMMWILSLPKMFPTLFERKH
jgi:hypothetical protein